MYIALDIAAFIIIIIDATCWPAEDGVSALRTISRNLCPNDVYQDRLSLIEQSGNHYSYTLIEQSRITEILNVKFKHDD